MVGVPERFVIIGGGPAGNVAATYAARLGAEVTVIERDVIGGAAHLWDCIPSKSMIATGGAMSFMRRSQGMGLEQEDPVIDTGGLTGRIDQIKANMRDNTTQLLESQNVRLIRGTGAFTSANSVEVTTAEGTETIEFDSALVSTGSQPRIPDWCHPDGERILTTRDCYPPTVFPDSVTVVGSGVTGVEFVHMFSSFGAKVTLVVSRQQVLPGKDPEVAAVLEQEFMDRGVKLLMGARAEAIERIDADGNPDPDGSQVIVRCDDGRSVTSSHAVLAIGSVPNTADIGLDRAGVEVNRWGYVDINHHCVTNVPHIYAAGDISGKLPLSSVASIQGRKVAEHVMGLHTRSHRHLDYDKAASAIFTEPEIADVGLAEAEAFASGRKIRVTKVPFSATAKAMINNDTRGFVKIISDPATGVILGGSIVGRHAAELISVIAVAVTAGLTVTDIVESILVHPALSEALAEAAE
ncbi:dihydrolipoyl dehydrogenase family protein [Ilumatobacter coccineus]|uniref:Putative NAD(P)H quinone reductase n=1 Tax=Ilumatobacter coccineus (strain NBRC 103263 / KCTC 29153 / YM16-304) TaxID=1313172 RepID=A0A6C7EDK8_ILUCY|nr:putative NAD(P)H quinone reductase [Ilumatobacter coccineus YM16-304]